MAEVVIDLDTVERLVSATSDEGGGSERHRQLLGLQLARTLSDQGDIAVRDPARLSPVLPMADDPTSDPRFGWPHQRPPDLVELVWPAPKLPREPLEESQLRISPWALHSLLLGDWGAPVPGTVLRLPECVALLLCDGLTENPAGRDLLRVTGQLEVLSFPTHLHSQMLVCGLADGVGQLEVEIQVLAPDESEVGFAIKQVFCPAREVATFYVANLDDLEVPHAGRYWFVLRLLGQEISRLPLEVGVPGDFEGGGWVFGQAWTWEGDVFFGERD